MQKSVENIAKTHYENFPVGSFLIPKRYREPIHLVYTFARVADDFADEGTMSVVERIDKLNEWQMLLHKAVKGQSSIELFDRLSSVIKEFQIPLQLFDDLIIAFSKDASNPEYQTFDEVLEYCKFSANPIGRIVLQIFECSTDETNRLSDAICTALQLTNFWQDISVDTRRNRIYIPKSDLQMFSLQQSDLTSSVNEKAFRELMKMQIDRTRNLFETGKPLFSLVNKQFRFELKMIWHGGMRILEKIELQNFETRNKRPTLNLFDKLLIFIRSQS
ncbi:MAG: squalene synthase HpnC [Bacteroidota bacterium]|nr:squalene synthase HpnC [Bacteroidota bacterium]